MKRPRIQRLVFVVAALCVIDANADPAARPKAPHMIMRTLAADQLNQVADGLDQSLANARLSGQRPLVIVHPRENANLTVMNWLALHEGDVIRSLNSETVSQRESIVDSVRHASSNKTLLFDILRDGQPIAVSVRVLPGAGSAMSDSSAGDPKTPPSRTGKPVPTTSTASAAPGNNGTVITLNEAQLEREWSQLDPVALLLQARPYMAYDTNGAIVGITSDSMGDIPIARKVGLRNGDIIRAVNNIPITSEASLFSLADQLEGQKTFVANLYRNGKPFTLTLRLQ